MSISPIAVNEYSPSLVNQEEELFKRKKCLWAPEMDAKVKNAISEYNKVSDSPFPETIFGSNTPSFCVLKRGFLQDLDKSTKQIRERWLSQISPKIKASGVLEEDKEVVWSFCQENPHEWSKVSRRTFEHFQEKYYYPDCAIKNFYYQRIKKNRGGSIEAVFVSNPLKGRVRQVNQKISKVPLSAQEEVVAKLPRACKKRKTDEGLNQNENFSGVKKGKLLLSEGEELALINSIVNENVRVIAVPVKIIWK